MNLLISGGHLSPALAIIDTLQRTQPKLELAFVGRELSQQSIGQPAGEAEVVIARQIPFFPMKTAKWGGSFWQRCATFGSVVRATIAAHQLLKQLRPDIFLSFGSYIAVPVAIACKLRGIPVIIHEQTRVAGISNRVVAWWAAVIAVSYPESLRFFPKHKTIVTGLPLRPQLFDITSQTHHWASPSFIESKLPILYVTGGNTGSHALNETIVSLLPELLQSWRIIHACGRVTAQHDWYSRLLAEKARLPAQLRAHYVAVEHVSASDLAWIYRQKTLVFGRAGANTTAEVAAFNLFALFVPLPLSNYDEQQKNAAALVGNGRTVVIDQAQLNRETLLGALTTARTALLDAAVAKAPPLANHACTALIKIIRETYQKK